MIRKTKGKTMLNVLLILLVLALSGWGEKNEVIHTINKNKKKVITHVTTGRINADTGVIGVKFSEDQISAGDVRRFIKNTAFEFSPKIEGRIYWTDKKTVVFMPNAPLPRNVKFVGTLKVKELFWDIQNPTSNSVAIEIETAWNRVVNFNGDFVQWANIKDKLVYKGKIEFSEEVNIEEVRKAVKLKEWIIDKKMDFATKDKKTYAFVSELLDRKITEKKYQFVIKKDNTGLYEDYKLDIATTPAGKLSVIGIAEELYKGQAGVKITFSDSLDETKNYTNFVKISPNAEAKVKAYSNTLMIFGNFVKGKNYNFTVAGGMRSATGNVMAQKYEFSTTMKLADMNPKLEFVSDGVYLTSAKNKKIEFRTLNLERVFVKLKRVSEENLIEFLNENRMEPSNGSYSSYNRYRFKRVGEIIDAKMLYIGKDKNKWIQSEIDLSKVLNKNSQGLYVLQIDYNEDDALYFSEEWNDWEKSDYIYENGSKAKHIIVSDVGITAKVSSEKIFVTVNDILTTKPIPMAVVKVKDAQNKVLAVALTNSEGMVEIAGVKGEKAYIEVKYFNQFSILKLNESELTNSLFDVGGINVEGGVKMFVYTDRGVYRPGDEIHLSAIVRNEYNTFPDNHPVTLKVFNPQDNMTIDITNKEAKDGFYSFSFKTNESDPTGNWKVKMTAGSAKYTGDLRIEEIVPYRIKVDIESPKEELTLDDRIINFKVNSKYLFGAPASNLETSSKIVIEPYEIKFDRYKKYSFANKSMQFQKIKSEEIKKQLDNDGNADIDWNIPEITDVPSALKLNLETKVMEAGGRMVPKTKSIPYKIYDRYVGIEELADTEIETGSKAKFNIILVSNKGELVPNKKLNYKIYRMNKYWWWEFDDSESFKSHFKTDTSTVLQYSGTINSLDRPVSINYTPAEYGEMLLEVEDPESGHKAGYFFRSYWWGAAQTGKGADTINIKSDKERYVPGETARIITKTPDQGRALVTIEKGDKLIYKKWEELKSNNTEFRIPITANMIPNAYVNVTVFQPYEQTKNDLPIRMYGIVSIKVDDKKSHLEFSLKAPDSIKPQKDFDIEIQTADKSKAQFTLAVVDEGLLDITQFGTPAPWDWFFKKERMLFRNYDLYSDIMSLAKVKSSKVFSVGGDGDSEEEDFRKKELSPDKVKRFKPVALWKGPFMTDERGHAKVTFSMPDYNGAVRVMAVGTSGGKYGSHDKSIGVKAPLIIMPTLPRVLGPKDKIIVPVTIFSTEGETGNVKVSIETSGPIKVTEETEKSVLLGDKGSVELFFQIEAKEATGSAKITIVAETEKYKAKNETDIAVRPYNNYTYITEAKIIKEKTKVKFRIPDKGIKGTNAARLTLSLRKDINIEKRIKWLIKYPYGCIEQTTSSILPQLYLKDLYDLSDKHIIEIDNNINEGIKRLMTFQTQSGGFSYWPGQSEADEWGTNYGGHFLIEAQKAGYYVPEDMMNKWIDYQEEETRSEDGGYLEKSYRLYLLALAGKPSANAMNLLKENHLKQMDNPEKHLLAGAYKLAGFDNAAQSILDSSNLQVKDYMEFDGTYGSTLRDKAVMMEALTMIGKTDSALALYNDIAEELSSDAWFSTQTLGYSLMAISKYIEKVSKDNPQLNAKVIFADKAEAKISANKIMYALPLDNHLGEEIEVTNDTNAPMYAAVDWEGIPVNDVSADESKNLNLVVEWLDETGNKIDYSALEQGKTIWGHYRIRRTNDGNHYRNNIANIALCQIIPSGWEIENTRLSGEANPEWTQKYNLNGEEYMDIRDDRIIWFFDFKDSEYYDFIVKINTVTAGKFYLSSAVAEAMYDDRYKAVVKGREIIVNRKENK